jgi:hypothetical protein
MTEAAWVAAKCCWLPITNNLILYAHCKYDWLTVSVSGFLVVSLQYTALRLYRVSYIQSRSSVAQTLVFELLRGTAKSVEVGFRLVVNVSLTANSVVVSSRVRTESNFESRPSSEMCRLQSFGPVSEHHALGCRISYFILADRGSSQIGVSHNGSQPRSILMSDR